MISSIYFRLLVCCSVLCTLSVLYASASDPATCIRCRKAQICNPPKCFCCRDEMPLKKEKEIPQMVFFTFDDAVTPQVASYYRQLFDASRRNPNGCPVKMTLFISHKNTVYSLVREFYQKGMEIASHSVTHSHPSSSTFLKEAKQQKKNLAERAKIPENRIVGWRSPYLEPLGDAQPDVLNQLGYRYDATLTISKKNAEDNAPVPFTLDFGWPYDCKIKPCPLKSHKGFWEVPVISIKDYVRRYDCVYVDGCNNPPPDEESAYKFLVDNFNMYYKSNRAPFGVNMHASWFYYPDRKAAMNRFIQDILKLGDVYLVSVKQVIDWLSNPVPLSEIKNFEPWQCDMRNHTRGRPASQKSAFDVRQEKIQQSLEERRRKQLVEEQLKIVQQHNEWMSKQKTQTPRRQTPIPLQPPSPTRLPSPLPKVETVQAPRWQQTLLQTLPTPIRPPQSPNHPLVRFWWSQPVNNANERTNTPLVQAFTTRQVSEPLIGRTSMLSRFHEQQRQQALERERQLLREQELNTRKQQANQELDRQRVKDAQMQREAERLKQQALEKKQLEQQQLERQKKLIIQHQIELELQKQEALLQQQQLEKEKARQAQLQKQKELELQKAADLRQKEIEKQRQIEIARQRQLELERQAEIAREEQLRQEAERQRLAEIERRKELARQAEQEQQRLAAEKAKQEELRRQQELEKQRLAEIAKQKEIARLQELEKQRQAEIARQEELKRLELERQRLAEIERQKELQRQQELERQKELQRLQELEKQRLAELERQKELQRQQELEKQRLAELERQKELQRQQELERQKKEEFARQQEILRQQELERQRLAEIERQNEIKRQKELQRLAEKERQESLLSQVLEQQRKAANLEKQRLAEQQQQKEQERLRNLEQQRLQDIELRRQQEATKQEEIERQKAAELQRQRELQDQVMAEIARRKAQERQAQLITDVLLQSTDPQTTKSTDGIMQSKVKQLEQILALKTANNPGPQLDQQQHFPTQPSEISNKVDVSSSKLLESPTLSEVIDPDVRVESLVKNDQTQNLHANDKLFTPQSKPMWQVDLRDLGIASSPLDQWAKKTTLPSKRHKKTSTQETHPVFNAPQSSKSVLQFFGFSDFTPSESLIPHRTSKPTLRTAPPPIEVATPAPRPVRKETKAPEVHITEQTVKALLLGPKPMFNTPAAMADTTPSTPSPQPSKYTVSTTASNATCVQGQNCIEPQCRCKSYKPPNGLKAKEIPQIVYITVDGNLNFHSYAKMNNIFSRTRVNPNGCGIKGTVYAADSGTSYRIVDLLKKSGMEVGLNGLYNDIYTDVGALKNDIYAQVDRLTRDSSIKPSDIKGWRSPQFAALGDGQFDVLSNYSMYDSSLYLDRSGMKNSKVWPFTMDFGWNEACDFGSCPTKKHPGVWEVPVIPYKGPSNSGPCEYVDGCPVAPSSEEDTMNFLMSNFNEYYKGNRAPFGIRVKQVWFHWFYRSNLNALIKFLDKILALGDVYIVTVEDMLKWMQNPTPLKDLDKFSPWQC